MDDEHRKDHIALEHRVFRIEVGIAMVIFMIPIAVTVTMGVIVLLRA